MSWSKTDHVAGLSGQVEEADRVAEVIFHVHKHVCLLTAVLGETTAAACNAQEQLARFIG